MIQNHGLEKMMTDIKMSDVFDLPMQQGDHQKFLLDRNDVYICETEYNNQSEAAKIAINAYDANQERIADLDEMRKNSMECIKGQRDIITELEKTIKQQQAMINFQAIHHNLMVDLGVEREKEINRLKSKLAEQNNGG